MYKASKARQSSDHGVRSCASCGLCSAARRLFRNLTTLARSLVHAQGMMDHVDLSSPRMSGAELRREDVERLIAAGGAGMLADKSLNGLDLSGLDLARCGPALGAPQSRQPRRRQSRRSAARSRLGDRGRPHGREPEGCHLVSSPVAARQNRRRRPLRRADYRRTSTAPAWSEHAWCGRLARHAQSIHGVRDARSSLGEAAGCGPSTSRARPQPRRHRGITPKCRTLC